MVTGRNILQAASGVRSIAAGALRAPARLASLVCLALASCGGDPQTDPGSVEPPIETGVGGAGGAETGSGPGAGGAETGSGGAGGGATPACVKELPHDPLVVATTAGAIRGVADGQVQAFRGVPYAEAPVGARRFRAPEPLGCWEGVRDATDYGEVCRQTLPGGQKMGSEDCLFLNVWTPEARGDGNPRPVLFFVHGGAYIFGSGNQDLFLEGTGNMYDGRALAEAHDVVVVTVNYRLAQLGFLAHPALSKEDPQGSSGNYGILDQIAALRWVQDNIRAFGGDPDRVMLFGESAGGLSTCLLVSSPLAKGLFSSALMESGGCTVATRASREAQGIERASDLGCQGAPDVAACLREKPADDFHSEPAMDMGLFLGGGDIKRAWEMPYGPNIDGHVFEEPPLEAIRGGRHNKVPFGIGSNAHEFEIFAPPIVNNCLEYYAVIGAMFGDLAGDVLKRYRCTDYPFARWAAVDVGTDFMFTCPARRVARAAAAGGSPGVYRYYYDHRYSKSPLSVLRAFHASELPFVFNTFGVIGYKPTEGDRALSAAMGGYWTRLARTGDPNGDGAYFWPPYDASADQSLVLDDELSKKSKIAETRCDFWDSIAIE